MSDDFASRQARRFAENETVQRSNQPEAIGIVRRARWDEQLGGWNYQVQFGAQLKFVPEGLLEPLRKVTSPWDALGQGIFAGVRHFSFTMTFHRLRRPPSRIAYSFATSRTQFYPHQFKPLLKFLDNPQKRLLIADDVGLGKTIEAGYILRELDARVGGVERVLVLVPARLRSKWRRELRDRFRQEYEIIGRRELLLLAERIRRGSEPEPFKWIASYESARDEEVRAALEQTQPPIDLLIADEAHRMRNSGTLQHRLGAVLSNCSENVILLSATPVQNRLEDLWNLLRLLAGAQEFPQLSLFQNQMDANSLLLRAQRALAQQPSDLNATSKYLREFFESEVGKSLASSTLAASLSERLAAPNPSRREIVEMQADLGNLSPIGHLLSRTRKADALAQRPQRNAVWIPVAFSPLERRVYQKVEDICRVVTGSWGSRMALLMAYRMTASCIPAALRYFTEKLGTPGVLLSQVIEEFDEEMPSQEEESEFTKTIQGSQPKLADSLLVYDRMGKPDSKLTLLIEELERLWRSDDQAGKPRRKIVIFSFFRYTLEYLAQQLNSRGITNRLIHGRISVADREQALDEFVENLDIAVLLTSEVGGEGVDLQRAAVLINYDLPWNPMVVEQRIGRIDRIGQEADQIVIVNLVVKDSIEEQVLQRLLDKIGIFKESIGELDPIIGQEVERLTQEALNGTLSGEQLETAVRQKGDAWESSIALARQMLSRVDNLMAADQGIVDEIHAVTGERQIPAEDELLLFLNTFLALKIPGRQIPPDATRRVITVDLRGPLGPWMEAAAAELDVDVIPFARRIAAGPVDLTLSREAAYRNLRAQLLHLRHPLVRYAVLEMDRDQGRPSAFFLRLRESSVLSRGLYGFAVSLFEIHGLRPTTRMAVAIAELGGQGLWTDPDQTAPLLLEALSRGEDAEAPVLQTKALETLQERLELALDRLNADWDKRERTVDQARRDLQKAALRTALELRIKMYDQRLDTLNARSAAAFPIRMAEAAKRKAQEELSSLFSAENVSAWRPLVREDVAVGLVRIDG